MEYTLPMDTTLDMEVASLGDDPIFEFLNLDHKSTGIDYGNE